MEKFSWRKRFKSFSYAFAGLVRLFKSEHNTWIHLGVTVIVIAMAIIFKVSFIEVVLLVFAIGFVWVAELFNTCIEKIMDFVSGERLPQIQTIKDMSAAAVLIAAIIAVIIGCLVFIPKIF